MKTWNRRETIRSIAEKIYNTFLEEVEKREPPNRIWLTDTVYCGRKKLFAMLNLKPRYDEDILSRIWLGRIFGSALEDIGIAKEVEIKYREVKGKIDCIAETGEPIEIKFATSVYITASEYTQAHVEQLSRYCLAVNKDVGILLYYVPGLKISNLPVYKYKFDLEMVKNETDTRLDILEKAVKYTDPFIIPATWHSANFNNWECRKCIYIDICKQGGSII